MDPNLFKPKAWEQFLLTGQLFDETNDFIFKGNVDDDVKYEQEVESPVFIVGCGRSGTTLIGNILNKHEDVLFLNEPRSIWLSVFPECDVWSFKALFNKSSITLCPLFTDIEIKTKRIKGFYRRLLEKYNKKIIVDKFPSHSFRIDLLQKMFPKCKIIHIKRNGYNVSKSISKFTMNAWYGIHGNIKWEALKTFIIKNDLIKDFQSIIDRDKHNKKLNMKEMGLIEWTASILAVKQSININYADNNYIEIKYEDITNRNKNKCYQTVKRLFEFVDKNKIIKDSLIYASMDIIRTKEHCCNDKEKENNVDLILFDETKFLLNEYNKTTTKFTKNTATMIILNDLIATFSKKYSIQ